MNHYPNIAINTKNGIQLIEASDIMYCLSDGNYTHIHLMNGQKLITAKKLKTIEEGLEEDFFVRIHHSHLINLSGIETVIKGNINWKVVMQDGTQLSISKSRKSEFQNHFKWF